MHRFIHNALKDFSSRHFCKTHNLSTNPDTLANINKLIKLRNYFKKKIPQLTVLNRYRNTLNNHIKNIIICIRNENWADKLKTRDNSLWLVLKSLQRVPSPPFVLSDQSLVYDPKNKAETLATYFHSVHLQTSNLTSAAVNDYVV